MFDTEYPISRQYQRGKFRRGSLDDVWSIGKARNKNKGHGAVFPDELVSKILENFSEENDIVYDPFMGTGTTAVVSKKIGRNYFGIEKEKKYYNIAEQRLEGTTKIEDHCLDVIKNNKSKPRIPFGSLIEMGIIKPGMEIFDSKKKVNAIIMVDGSIKHNESEGSIHKVAAKIIGTESCNGWTYWHYHLNGALVPIDNLRQKLISKNY